MKLNGLLLGSAAISLAFLTSSSSLLATGGAEDVVNAGSEVSYTFRTPPVNSAGLSSLEGLRGKPVLVEFWGTR